MISVANVSMRYGSKILFDDVTTTFSAGPPLRPDRTERRRQVDVHEAADRRAAAAEGHRRPARRSSASCARISSRSTRFRVIDTVIMGNARLWAALEERERLYAKADMTDEDGMRLGELEGDRRRRGRLHARRATRRSCCRASTSRTRCTSGRWASCRAARRCACCWRRRCSATRRRCCSTSRPTISTSTRSTGCRTSWSATTAR